MARFDMMGFSDGGWRDTLFVAHAKKYTKEQVVAECINEYSNRFDEDDSPLREPTIHDVKEGCVGFRLGVDNHVWPEGCYTFVRERSPGSFPVWIIDFEILEVLGDEN